jgi:hypothetical protein
MSTFVKLNNARNDRYLGLTLAKGVSVVPGASSMGMCLKGGIVSGKKQASNSPFDSDSKKKDSPFAGPQLLTVSYGVLASHKYEVMLAAHPDMYKIGIISHPILLVPEQETQLTLQLLAYASADGLKDLPWELSLYLVD